MVIRIDMARPEGEGVALAASLVDNTDPENLVVLLSESFFFDSNTSPTAAMVTIQKGLNQEATRSKKVSKLLEAFPEGETFPPKSEAETRVFLGMD